MYKIELLIKFKSSNNENKKLKVILKSKVYMNEVIYYKLLALYYLIS